MKNVTLFVAIMTICGSLMKAPVYRMCQTELSVKYYKKGKLVRREEVDGKYYSNIRQDFEDHQNGNIVSADSIAIEPKYTTYRMLE